MVVLFRFFLRNQVKQIALVVRPLKIIWPRIVVGRFTPINQLWICHITNIKEIQHPMEGPFILTTMLNLPSVMRHLPKIQAQHKVEQYFS